MESNAELSAQIAEWNKLIEEGNSSYAAKHLADAEIKFADALKIAEAWAARADFDKLSAEEQRDLNQRLAKGLNNMAALFHSQGKYAMAEELYNRCLDLKIKLHGENHLDVAVNLHNLAALHSAKSRWIMAEPMYKRSLEIRESLLGPEHIDLVSILKNYALMLRRIKRDQEAERLEERATRILENAQVPAG